MITTSNSEPPVVIMCVGRREHGFASVLRQCFSTLLHTHHNEHKRINSVGFLTHLCSFACCQHKDSQIQQGQQRSLLRVTWWWESTADTSLVFWAASPRLKVEMRSSMRRSLQPKSLGILVVLCKKLICFLCSKHNKQSPRMERSVGRVVHEWAQVQAYAENRGQTELQWNQYRRCFISNHCASLTGYNCQQLARLTSMNKQQ